MMKNDPILYPFVPMNLEFTIPANVSFEEAIGLTQDLLLANPSDDVLASAVTALIQTVNGARGFFVTLLSGDFEQADRLTPGLIQGLRSNPDAIADLMMKNIAMPTAMALTHERNGDLDRATSSQRTQRRSIALVQALNLPAIHDRILAMQATLENQSEEYQSFLDRWGYDEEQRSAIGKAMQTTLTPQA